MSQQGFIQDLEVFIKERAAQFDETLDVSDGSPFDTRVIQPILRRVGVDPFSTDVELFIQDRMNQEFPDLVTKAGDGITDLLIKPLRLLLDPIVRENARIKRSLSFKDPELLTTEEADALGGNLFAVRETGNLSRVPARIYFSSPQTIVISPANYAKSRGGLRFFPDSSQSIRADEMLLNQEGTLFYFDINLVAEKAGDEYNIGPDELVTIANVPSAVRVTNKRRARFGAPAETATEFVDRASNELTERSLVTDRGIQAVLPKVFPDITRLAVIGFNDPEMKRDVLEGGGLGPLVSFGFLATPITDGLARSTSGRVLIHASEEPKFLTRIVAAGDSGRWVLTLMKALPSGSVPSVVDLDVVRVIDDQTLEVSPPILDYASAVSGPWMLRRKSLSLSKIPGGILFPDTASGTMEVPDGQVHIGGCTDIYLRGVDLDTATVAINNVTDDRPALSGIEGESLVDNVVVLHELVLGTDYQENDETFVILRDAVRNKLALRVLAGGAAGTYSILSVDQVVGSAVEITLRAGPTVLLTGLRWQLLDALDIDVLEPKETRLSGTDAQTVLGSAVVETRSGVNLSSYGISAGDTFRLLSGPDAGDFSIVSIVGLFSTQVTLDRALTHTKSNLKFQIFKANSEGGVRLPLVRISSIDLLDTSGQPVGTKIPYAKAVGVTSEAFANTASGVKVDVSDARLGLVGDVAMATSVTGIGAFPLTFRYGITAQDSLAVGGTTHTVTFPGVSYTRQQIVDRINLSFGKHIAVLTPEGRLGLLPFDGTTAVLTADNSATVLTALFGSATFKGSSRLVRSATVTSLAGNWASTSISPPIDDILDVCQTLSGNQIGFFFGPRVNSGALEVEAGRDFTPEADVRLQVGARSLGVARMHFLEPTSVEIGADTRFFGVLASGARVGFIPDPTNYSQKVPALPSGVKPKFGRCVSTSVFRSASNEVDFVAAGIEVGDHLVLDYLPLIGDAALPDPVPLLHGKTLVLSVEGVPDQTITFVNDSASIPATSVTRKAVADQINSQVGKKIASISSSNKLELEATFSLTLRTSGTANSSLKFGSLTGHLRNESPNKFSFPIESLGLVDPDRVTLDITERALVLALTGDLATYSDINRQQFSVIRPRTQRISVTEMSANVGDAGLYYWDVQLMSEGTGNIYNVPDRTEMTVENYRSDGYWMSVDNEERTFSTTETSRLHLSRSIMPVGVNDSPQNALELSGQNIQINYERSSLVSSVQAYVSAESERVTNNSPLVRHLVPYFFRVDISYTGGTKERDLQPIIEEYVRNLLPSDGLESSDLQKLVSDAGATSIENPLELFAVVHNPDRTVVLERSQNRLNTGRLAAFIPDVLTLNRAV